ncbi:hypothetical protein BH23PLA1_BH23PLA1_06080 [soil metagenome]
MDLIWWAVIAFVVAMVAGALGFTNVAAGASTIGRVLFGIFLIIALIILVMVVLGVGAVAAV